MSIVGKRLIINGANWSEVRITQLKYNINLDDFSVGSVKELSVWVEDSTFTTITVTSSNTSIFTVGNRTGTGTTASPFIYPITGVASGDASIIITMDEGLPTEIVRNLSVTIVESEVPEGYTKFDAIHVGSTSNGMNYVDCNDVTFSQDYNYLIQIKKDLDYSVGSSALMGFLGATKVDGSTTSSYKSFGIWLNKTGGVPDGAKVGYWWDNVDTSGTFNGLPTDGILHTITIEPSNTQIVYTSDYNNNTLTVSHNKSTNTWNTGFRIFGISGSYTSAKQCSIGKIIVTDANGIEIYKFVPCQNSQNLFGYYESVNKKFYPFNTSSSTYSAISGENFEEE